MKVNKYYDLDKRRNILGWIGVCFSLIISGIWAYWGTVENFHEGWYSELLWVNLFMLVFQYLLITIMFILLAVIALRWKRMGLVLHLALGGFCVWFFSGANFLLLGLFILLPVLILGSFFYWGEPKPRKLAYGLLIGVPLVIIMVISVPEGIKVAQRIDDHDFGTKIIEGNGVALAWAPRGPGWPDQGTSWEEACRICKYLSEDGSKLMKEEQNIWRLPTVDETVRSMELHGKNAGGAWNKKKEKATYVRRPDKESPLWVVHSKVIYYWTSDTLPRDGRYAYIIVYHGGVFTKKKSDNQDYLSFRAVKEIDSMDTKE